jgi:hypothetical protein
MNEIIDREKQTAAIIGWPLLVALFNIKKKKPVGIKIKPIQNNTI